MIRFPLRLLGFILTALGFVVLVIDGTRTIAGQRLIVTSLAETWRAVHPASLAQAETLLREGGPPWAWDPAAIAALALPTALAGLVLGALLMWLGRAREPQIGVIGRR